MGKKHLGIVCFLATSLYAVQNNVIYFYENENVEVYREGKYWSRYNKKTKTIRATKTKRLGPVKLEKTKAELLFKNLKEKYVKESCRRGL